jgi:hypothetical protein
MNQGTQGYSLMKKTEGRKSHDTVSLRIIIKQYNDDIQLHYGTRFGSICRRDWMGLWECIGFMAGDWNGFIHVLHELSYGSKPDLSDYQSRIVIRVKILRKKWPDLQQYLCNELSDPTEFDGLSSKECPAHAQYIHSDKI